VCSRLLQSIWRQCTVAIVLPACPSSLWPIQSSPVAIHESTRSNWVSPNWFHWYGVQAVPHIFLAVSCFCRCPIFFCSFLLVIRTLWNINPSCSCRFLWVSHDLSLVVHMEVFIVDVTLENTKQDWYKASHTKQDHMAGLTNSAVWKIENSRKGCSHLKKSFGPASRFFHNGAGLRGLGTVWRSQKTLF